MNRTGKKSAFTQDPELFNRIMKQASLRKKGNEIAKILGISTNTATTSIYVTRCIEQEDWEKVKSSVRNGVSEDLLMLASKYAEKELPEEVWKEYNKYREERRQRYQAKQELTGRTKESFEIDEEKELKPDRISIYEQKMLCNSSQMQELMIQLMDTVIPKYFGDSGTTIYMQHEMLQELCRLRNSVDLLTAAVTRISEESLPNMEKKHIDANADMLNDTLRGIRENCGKLRGKG